MNNDIWALSLNDGVDLAGVTDVSGKDFGRSFAEIGTFDLGIVKVVKIVDDNDGIAPSGEYIDQMRTDEPSTACDQDFHQC